MEMNDEPEIQYEAAWALCNIASGTTEQVQYLIQNGALSKFIRLLQSGHDKIVDQSIWALGNIAGDSVPFRDLILEQGAVRLLVEILNKTQNLDIKKNGTWALANFCKGKPLPDFQKVKDAVPLFCSLLQTDPSTEISCDAAWGLSYLSEHSSDNQGVIPMGIVPIFLKHIENSDDSVKNPCIRAIGNIIAATEGQTNILVQVPTLVPQFFKLLDHPKVAFRREACWIISNISAGTTQQIEFIVGDPAQILKLISVVQKDSEKVKREALWALANAASSGNELQAQKLVSNGVLDCFLEALSFSDPKMIQVALEGIQGILKNGAKLGAQLPEGNPFITLLEEKGGLEKIEMLQTHASDEVYKHSVQILEEFFALEEEA